MAPCPARHSGVTLQMYELARGMTNLSEKVSRFLYVRGKVQGNGRGEGKVHYSVRTERRSRLIGIVIARERQHISMVFPEE